MIFCIIQDTNRNDNPPFAAHGTSEEVAARVCNHMHNAYLMPASINTLQGASDWFSGCVEEGEEKYEENMGWDNVFWWDTEKMKK